MHFIFIISSETKKENSLPKEAKDPQIMAAANCAVSDCSCSSQKQTATGVIMTN